MKITIIIIVAVHIGRHLARAEMMQIRLNFSATSTHSEIMKKPEARRAPDFNQSGQSPSPLHKSIYPIGSLRRVMGHTSSDVTQ